MIVLNIYGVMHLKTASWTIQSVPICMYVEYLEIFNNIIYDEVIFDVMTDRTIFSGDIRFVTKVH